MRKVGKKIGGCLYIHKSAIKTLSEAEVKLVQEKEKFIPKDFKYQIIKINLKEDKVSFISSDDWNTSSEPLVGDGYCVSKDNNVKLIKSKGQIYHHRWMFVNEDYLGFNIEESKRWSEQWKSIIPQTKDVLSRIGYKKYWIELLTKYKINS